jgi:hypothetical protein
MSQADRFIYHDSPRRISHAALVGSRMGAIAAPIDSSWQLSINKLPAVVSPTGSLRIRRQARYSQPVCACHFSNS